MSASTTPQSRSTAESDPALVAAYRLGDERAAGELIQRHIAALGRFLYSSGADRDEVDDLVQETLFRAFRRLASWRGEASFRSWLFTIGHNLLRDHFRSRKSYRALSLDQDVPGQSDPHSDLAATEAEERIRQGLAGLPRLQREVFLLRAQEGIEYEEIAVELGTTPGAARVHYHHAVKRLKELVR
ncbi:MAG TPA: RNA polymerase sigma factor [Gemmatimonadales bacterium]|jgi:RNA polymerase sigma-70 factor (ECF subfamily)|nr:RNA polymerase sigma factor [Gemmatimonadales bacterium]